tara:strand:- start:32 stop:265 length:234 start_codon:yes stop_codon:yes gene_type:complete
MKKKTFNMTVSAEATIHSPSYKIKADTPEEAFRIACERFSKVIDRIERTKYFSAQPSEINFQYGTDEFGNWISVVAE